MDKKLSTKVEVWILAHKPKFCPKIGNITSHVNAAAQAAGVQGDTDVVVKCLLPAEFDYVLLSYSMHPFLNPS